MRRVRARHRRVVARVHGDRHGRDVRLVDAVTRAEREAVRAVVVRRRRVRPVRSGPGERAVRGRRDDRVREQVAVRVGRHERDRKCRVLIRGLALRGRHRRAVVVRDRALALPVDDVPAGRVREVDEEDLVDLVESVDSDIHGERLAHDSRGEVQNPRCRPEVDARARRPSLRGVVDARRPVRRPRPRDRERHRRRSGVPLRDAGVSDRDPRIVVVIARGDLLRARCRVRDEPVADALAEKRRGPPVGRRAARRDRERAREQDGAGQREQRQAHNRQNVPCVE